MNVIEMRNITMAFGNFKANDNVDFTVEKGEIHALIGENGAGKSTLMSVLFGMYKATSGSIYINGVERIIANPIEANKLGIGMVHQHFMLVDTFTLFENIILNSEDTFMNFLTTKEARKRVELIMDKYNFHVDLDKLTSKASVAEQQRTEILKMLFKDSEILILDEPTAVLTPQQIDEFLKAILNLQKLGKTIVIISHKLDELKKVAKRGTIIRKGKVVGSVNLQIQSKEEISGLMVGATINVIEKPETNDLKLPVLSINNLTVNKNNSKVIGLHDFSVTLNAGEIVAIAGVEGNGQEEIINAVSGLSHIKSGEIILHSLTKRVKKSIDFHNKMNDIFLKKINKKIAKNELNVQNTADEAKLKKIEEAKTILISKKESVESKIKANNTINISIIQKTSIKERYENGMAFVPQDRHKHGLVLDMKVWENVALQDFDEPEYSKFGFLKFENIKKSAKDIISTYDVRSSNGMESRARSLSGGNQQKLIVGREFSKKNSKYIIVSQPTRGLDVGAINNIHTLIFKAKAEGKAILLISYELDEVLKLADRVVVINAGRKINELPIKGLTKEKLGELMTTSVGGEND